VIGALGRLHLHVSTTTRRDNHTTAGSDLSERGAVLRRAPEAPWRPACPSPTLSASLHRRCHSSHDPPVPGRCSGRIRTTMDAAWRDALSHRSPALRPSHPDRDPSRVGKLCVCFGSRACFGYLQRLCPTNTFGFSRRPERNLP
jgi:hypothetical protein